MRTKKKAWDSGDIDVANGDGDNKIETMDPIKDKDAAIDSGAGTTPACNSKKYLNIEHIHQLESIGFEWSPMSKPKTASRSWDDRLEDLRQYHEEHGTYTEPRNSSLGEWLHNQRALYGKRDTRFMERRAPRMVAIGYVFDVRDNTTVSVSWED